MRKFLTSAAAAVCLSACTATQVQQAEQFLGQVQSYTAQVCHFIPEIGSIVAILNATAGATVVGVGSAICALVPPPASARYKALPRYGVGAPAPIGAVGGISVNGWRV